MLKIENFTVMLKKNILLKSFTKEILKGSLICLKGTNGIGKTTILKGLSGLYPNVTGDLFINNQNIFKINNRERAKLLSIYLTTFPDANHLTVYELVLMGRYPHGNYLKNFTKEDHFLVDNILEKLNLSNFKNRFFSNLSDGEKARVLIARSVSQDTPVILLDEPFAYLDYLIKPIVINFLKELTLQNKIILFTSHEDIVSDLVDTIWLIDNNQITCKN